VYFAKKIIFTFYSGLSFHGDKQFPGEIRWFSALLTYSSEND